MEEQNDMNSPLLTETSTSKLTAKQPLTKKKKHWNQTKKIPYIQIHNTMVGRVQS